jgi:hypothetical protein
MYPFCINSPCKEQTKEYFLLTFTSDGRLSYKIPPGAWVALAFSIKTVLSKDYSQISETNVDVGINTEPPKRFTEMADLKN